MLFQLFAIIELLIKLAVGAIIVLMLLRGLISWAHLNPFGWFAYHVRQITEPLLAPLRRSMSAFQSRRDLAPLLLVFLVFIIAYFLLGLLDQLRLTIGYSLAGLNALGQNDLFLAIRYLGGALAVGVIAVVITCIIVQVFFSWVAFHGNWITRLVYRVSEPVLSPFRRMIPPLGFFDISPLIAILVLSLLSTAIQVVLLPRL